MIREWKKQCLDGQWTLGMADNEVCRDTAATITTAQALEASGYTCLPGKVPGNFELDMQREGMIPDPFFGMNTLQMQDLEAKHLWYVRRFTFEGDAARAVLLFEGLDTFAEVYLNGEWIASTDNMLIPHEIPVPQVRQGENELLVHIKPTCIVAREFALNPADFAMKYSAASLKTRKAAHTFAWDIMPRIVSAGIWRSVWLMEKPAQRIEEAFRLYSKVSG